METPQSFLVRYLDLRQKILFASQEAESSLKYDPKLVQSMFLHTVLTGLQNDNIRGNLRPYLTQADVSDELLFDKVNQACAHETERQNKKNLSSHVPPKFMPFSPVTLLSRKKENHRVIKIQKSLNLTF